MEERLMTRADRGAAGAPARPARTNNVLYGITAAAVLLSADIHLVLWADGFSDIAIIGPLFMVNVVGGLLIGVVMLAWRHWLPLLAAIGFGAATFGAFMMSRTVGLFGIQEMMWDVQAVLAAVAEIVAVVGGIALLVARRGGRG